MRVRVSFRFNAATGQVEVFQVDDAHDGPALPDHDARHDAATRDVGRIVTAHPAISEVPDTTSTTTRSAPATSPADGPVAEETPRQPGQRLHD